MPKSYSFTGGIRLADQVDAIGLGGKVFVPAWDLFGVVAEREEGERVLGYFVRFDDGDVCRVNPDELIPVG